MGRGVLRHSRRRCCRCRRCRCRGVSWLRGYGILAAPARAIARTTLEPPIVSAMRHDQIALQLYTVRELTAVDLPGTLQAVAAAGYRAVELAGLPDIAPGCPRADARRRWTPGRRLARGHRTPARRCGGRRRSAGDLGCPRRDRALDARGGPPRPADDVRGSPPSSAGSPSGWRRGGSASATTTTTSSSRRSTGRRSGTSSWPSSRPRSSSSWTCTGRPWAAAIPVAEIRAIGRPRSGCST